MKMEKGTVLYYLVEKGLVIALLSVGIYYLWNDKKKYEGINEARFKDMEIRLQECSNSYRDFVEGKFGEFSKQMERNNDLLLENGK
jgi:hypothetical protein